jgi:hypothetical protein
MQIGEKEQRTVRNNCMDKKLNGIIKTTKVGNIAQMLNIAYLRW